MFNGDDLYGPVSFGGGGGGGGGGSVSTSRSVSRATVNSPHDGPAVHSAYGRHSTTTYSSGVTVRDGAYIANVNIPGNADGSIGSYAGRATISGGYASTTSQQAFDAN